ncbi:DDE-type integrase/transposase/recombinase, partial [Leptospira sp. Pond_2020]|uniref:DDE-type integrase/transposase/recombinase n=1 Tax=Leptospira sp. Pond_2020 TaxID=2846916 RepID=UPI0034D66ACB
SEIRKILLHPVCVYSGRENLKIVIEHILNLAYIYEPTLKSVFNFIKILMLLLYHVFHSDRGSNFCSKETRRLLIANGIRRSNSRKGNCWDNAVAESFFHFYILQ